MLGPGGPLHEMGVETQYTESIAVLLKRMSSRMWDYSVSGVAVDRARQAVHDRAQLNWVTGATDQERVPAACGASWLRPGVALLLCLCVRLCV